MKSRVGVYLSKQMAARLAAAAKGPGASKSALVEAALAQFLGDDDVDYIPVERRLSLMSRQLERLDQNLKIVNEIVALQARYQLAVTPPLPAAALRAACAVGAERFDEFATQVGRRVQSGAPLMQETIDRLGRERGTVTEGCGTGVTKIFSLAPEPDLPLSFPAAAEATHPAAVREGGSLLSFPGKAGIPLH